jgi:hypothetical protein
MKNPVIKTARPNIYNQGRACYFVTIQTMKFRSQESLKELFLALRKAGEAP